MPETLDPAYFEEWRLPYSKPQRERFRDGSLRDEWYARYEGCCFDEGDLRLATTQPANHFFEWLGAISLYNALGVHALVEKYESKKAHPRKFEVFERLMDPETLKFALDYATDEFGGTQCPDLLLYQPDLSDWFFCETKERTEGFTPRQVPYFTELAKRTGRKIRVIRFFAAAVHFFDT